MLAAGDPRDPDDAIAAELRRLAAIEAHIVACMAAAGFAWQPGYYTGIVAYANGNRLTPEQFANESGYGIATEIGQPGRVRTPVGKITDPNAATVAALSAEARVAYEEKRRTCYAEGEASAAADASVVLSGSADEVLAEVWSRVNSEERVRDARRSWVGCLASQGYDVADEESIKERLRQRAKPFLDAYEAAGNTGPIDQVLSAEQRDALVRLQLEERQIARADLGCRGDLDETRGRVYHEVLTAMAEGR